MSPNDSNCSFNSSSEDEGRDTINESNEPQRNRMIPNGSPAPRFRGPNIDLEST